MRSRPLISTIILALPAFLSMGCGNTQVADVTGRITLDGQPLANAVVVFQPVPTGLEINSEPGSDATTDADGVFHLKVRRTGQDGAVVGQHRVMISAFANMKPEKGGGLERRNVIQSRYNEKTTLIFDVPAGGTQEARFDLLSR